MTAIKPQNLAAQLAYRDRGNPPNTHATSAISNCFPGLEFDFRAIWRHLLKGIVLSENNNFVVGPESEPLVKLPIQDAEPKAPGTDLAYLAPVCCRGRGGEYYRRRLARSHFSSLGKRTRERDGEGAWNRLAGATSPRRAIHPPRACLSRDRGTSLPQSAITGDPRPAGRSAGLPRS
jgi:hypothetical protein